MSRLSILPTSPKETSLVVSHWKLRMVLVVEYWSTRLNQNKPFSGLVSTLLSCSAEFYRVIHTKKKLACITGAWAKRGEQGVSREAINECKAQDDGKRKCPTTGKQIRSRKKLLIPLVTQYQQALPGLKRILMGKWHLIQNQQRLREIFKKTPISYRKGKSLIRNTSSPQKLIGASLILDSSEVVWDILWQYK